MKHLFCTFLQADWLIGWLVSPTKKKKTVENKTCMMFGLHKIVIILLRGNEFVMPVLLTLDGLHHESSSCALRTLPQ